MASKFRHGGGYRQAAIEAGIPWHQVVDYSTSINWKAVQMYPDNLIYIHYDNTEYTNPSYPELYEIIEEKHYLQKENFLLTHGANEAISALFHMFRILDYHKIKEVLPVGPTYAEYHKHLLINGFSFSPISFNDLYSQNCSLSDKIVVIVNPNTPYGYYHDINDIVESLLKSGSIVIIDESFIDFTDKPSIKTLIKEYQNLYIIHSLTKFYGSPGARLGLIISNNCFLQDLLKDLLPHWTISTYDKWFYENMIAKYTQIKRETLQWVKSVNQNLQEVLKNSHNIKLYPGSSTAYHTLELSPDFIAKNNIQNMQRFFITNYNIYIRPTADFYDCSETSFRIGLRLPEENEPFFRAIREIE